MNADDEVVLDATERLGFEFRGSINGHTVIKFSWLDRIRVLFGGTVHVYTGTRTENDPGTIMDRETVTHVEPIFPLPEVADSAGAS